MGLEELKKRKKHLKDTKISESVSSSRLKSSSGKVAVSRRMVAICLAVGILMTGVAVTKAADYFKDSWRKKIEMARVENEVELKKVHLESIRKMASEMKARVANGMIREDEYQAIERIRIWFSAAVAENAF